MTQTNVPSGTRVSVVINTYNRGLSLRNTLDALRYQTHDSFEVIVVNGPSTDATEQVLADYPDARTARCPEVHLSKSRNIGIDAATGEIVAFIDDDAVPEATWLHELVAAHDTPRVGGAGGVTFDHTGFQYQYEYSVCDRLGNTRFDVRPPLDAYSVPGADPFIYLQGTNCSFRRSCLVEIGGFDEEIEYYMDEVDVCRRIIDLGYLLRPLSGAAVHHKYLASHLRNSEKVVFDPYPNVKNHCYLAILNNRDRIGLEQLKGMMRVVADGISGAADRYLAAAKLNVEQHRRFLARVEQGLRVGIEKGERGERLYRQFREPVPGHFRPYRTFRPEGGRLKVCFISQEFPPGDFGGIGRFTSDLASGFAGLGHEVHVVTRSPDVNRVDFEEGVWMHRLAVPERDIAELDGQPLAGNLIHSCAVYQEVLRTHQRGPLDVVSAPLWACEGLPCILECRFPTVLTLMTSMQTVASLHRSWRRDNAVNQMIALERETARRARFLHPISQAILAKVADDYGAPGRAEVLPLGARDRRAEYARRRGDDDTVRVLFVGRLERRKGVDVLLEAAVSLLDRFPSAEFVLVGKDTPNTETGETYRAAFERRFGQDPSVVARVRFTGAVSEDELYHHYADADIVVLPSRYESFGLVLVEGMMFGKPVVGCATGGMSEVVEEGGNGFLAQPADAAALADCLGKLLSDVELRRRFGERSRALYEQKFTLPVVCANTARYYRKVARWHARDEPTPEGTAERLAGVLAGVTRLKRKAAERAAQVLLDPSCYPVDYLATVRRFAQQPDEEFVAGVYRLLLGREPDEVGRARFLTGLAGMSRADVVRSLAQSEEARKRGTPTAWVDQFGPAAHIQDTRRATRSALRAVVTPRNLARYLKRVIYLPWRFQQLYAAFTEFRLQAEAHQCNQRLQSEQLEALLRDLHQREVLRGRPFAETVQAVAAHGYANTLLVQQELRKLTERAAEFDRVLAEMQKERARALHERTRCLGSVRQGLERAHSSGAEAGRSADGLPVPLARVVSPEGCSNQVAHADDSLRVNLAYGAGPLPGYLNVDACPGPQIDVVADVENLPFAAEALAELACANLIDRFPPGHFSTAILPHWRALLRPGGVLRITCSNWEQAAARLRDGAIQIEEFLALVRTWNDDGTGPAALYTPQSLGALLLRQGFQVEVIEQGSGNGRWPQMELLAHRFAEQSLRSA